MSAGGPSPVIPLLLVASLGLFIWSPDLMEMSFDFSELQESMASLVVALPILLFLIITFMTEMIVFPFLLLLVVIVLRNVLVGPLILLVVIYFLSKYYSSGGQRGRSDEQSRSSGGEGEGIGLGCFMLMLLFVILFSLFYEGENYVWFSLIFGLSFLFLLNMY